ncbi:hypothetical protein Barb7_03131 [Bacteroidales bacterium Barb7]|nr:hypothetical protein Barb7_03131 [Bacteroidales bacterium Barb7]
MAVALELQDGIHDMLQHFRACNAPFLIYMTDQQDGYAALLGIFQNGGTALAHLRHATGGGFHRL